MALRMSRGFKTLTSGAYKQTPASSQKVMDTFAKYKACAVLRTPKAEQCAPAMQAAIDGGFDIIEFTLTTPGCLDQVANFRKKYDGKVMIGCGTVMDIPDAKAADTSYNRLTPAPPAPRLPPPQRQPQPQSQPCPKPMPMLNPPAPPQPQPQPPPLLPPQPQV